MADQPIFYPVPPRQEPSIFDSFARAFMMGQQLRQQNQALEMEKQDRALRIEAFQQEAKRLKLEDKMRAFQLLQGQRGPMTEQAGPDIPALFSAGGGLGVPTTEQVEGQHPAFDFSEIQPGLRLQPQNLGDMLALEREKRMRELLAKVAETRATEQAKAEVARTPQTVNAPGVGEVTAPGNLLPDLLKTAAAEQARLQGQEFTAGQDALNRSSARGNALIAADATRAAAVGTREDKMLDDFARDTKDFAAVDDAYNKMVQARGGKTPQSDMALMYAYIRILDPTSAVREGEYATAANAGSVPEKVRAAYNKIVGGGLLADSQRESFVRAADTIRSGVEPRRQEVLKRYQKRAQGRGIDPNLFKMESGPAGGIITTPDGKRWRQVPGGYEEVR